MRVEEAALPSACLKLGNLQRPTIGIIIANHRGGGVSCVQFCSEVLYNASGTLSLYCGPDCNLLGYSQARKKVNTGLRHPYAIATGCILGLVAMVTV